MKGGYFKLSEKAGKAVYCQINWKLSDEKLILWSRMRTATVLGFLHWVMKGGYSKLSEDARKAVSTEKAYIREHKAYRHGKWMIIDYTSKHQNLCYIYSISILLSIPHIILYQSPIFIISIHWNVDGVVRLQHEPNICGLQVVGFLLDKYS